MAECKRGTPGFERLRDHIIRVCAKGFRVERLPQIRIPIRSVSCLKTRSLSMLMDVLWFRLDRSHLLRSWQIVDWCKEKAWGKAGWKERQAVALRRVCEVIGDKREEDLTAEDFALYLIKRYGAKEVTFEECLPYLEDPEEFEEDEDPVFTLTENWIDTETARIFILPARTKSYFNLCRQREGLIFYMGVKKDGRVYNTHWDENLHADAFNWYPYLREEEQLFSRNYVRVYGG